MTGLAWVEAALTRSHDRKAFNCGDPDLDLYLRQYARQNYENGGAKCFVASPPDRPQTVLGFYTVSPASLDQARTPAVASKGLGATTSRSSVWGASPSMGRCRGVASAALSCFGPPPDA